MRFALALICVLAVACGSNSKGGGADSGGDDGSNSMIDAPNGDSTIGGGTTIHVTLTNHPSNAAMFKFLVAFQDGSGAWKLAGAPSGDTYSFDVNSPSWGVVWTCVAGQFRAVTEVHFAVAERTSLTMNVPAGCTDNAPATVALTGTVSNRSGGGIWLVDFGGTAGFVNPQTGAYKLAVVPGTGDVVLRHVQSAGNVGNDFTTTEALVDRAVTVTGATTHDLDASNVIATQSFNVNIPLTTTSRALATTLLYSAGGAQPMMNRVTSNFESDALAATQGVSGDVYDQQIAVTANGQTAIVTNATATPGDQTFTAPTPLGGATSQVTTTSPYPIIHTTWSSYPSTIGYVWNGNQGPTPQQCGTASGCVINWTAVLSPGVTGSSPGYTMPDFSGLAGWDNSLAFVTGTTVTGYAEAGISSGGASDFPPVTPPPAGTQRTYVRSAFTVTP